MSTSKNSNNTASSGLPRLPHDYSKHKKDHHYFLGWAVTSDQLADIGSAGRLGTNPIGGMMHIERESKRKPIYIVYGVPVFENDPIMGEKERKGLGFEDERVSTIIMTCCDHGAFLKKYKLPSKRQVDTITKLLGGKEPAWYRDALPKKKFRNYHLE